MSNYTQITFFAPKDALLSGNPAKLIKGADVDPELAAIAAAIASKYDATNFAFQNPSATVGLTAVNGTSSNPMRSDAAPALSQAIAPTWSALHIFTGNAAAGQIQIGAAGAYVAPAVNRGVLNYDTASGVLSIDAHSNGGNTTLNLLASNAGTSATRISINGAAGITLATPPSGTGLTVNSVAGGQAITATGDGTFSQQSASTGANLLLQGAASGTTINRIRYSSNSAANNSFALRDNTAGVDRITVSANGNSSFTAPSSGVGVTVNAVSAGQALALSGSGSAFIAGISQNSTNTGYTSWRLYNDQNSAVRSLEIDYSGSTFASALLTNGPTGESAAIFATGAFPLSLGTSGTERLRITSAGLVQAVDQGGTLQDVGWRGTPLDNPGTSITAGLKHRGGTILATNGSTITVPNGVFGNGDVFNVLISSGASCTIAQGASFTLSWLGNGSSTGNRTLTGPGLASIMFQNSGLGFIGGPGLS